MATSTVASQEELKANRVPLAWRDTCSALLIPLNICRKNNMYKAWECEHERHTYEKCQYDDYIRRMKKLSQLKLAAAEESSE
ncbi:NADH-ubiquinone oxidoreductase B18 subunit-domain-containing protein [Gymnopilus junonius]|uniref:NADH dehydrogenase [ubiquinone] 1 beta subcomplex subunit 7 n=1 Tax=Gymnopilus junonius TaxID=109634 RepID=A0A9P5NNI8_GYMJU|nr:NADH-ubiquinone oxidoreductase B18 subunit-domain-containing protein [Gymnopilus junonius]